MSRGNGGQPDLVELLEEGEAEEAEVSGFTDEDGNPVGDLSDEDAGLTVKEDAVTVKPVDDVELVAKKPGERTIIAAGVMRRRPPKA